jgi:hypothetical protein
MNKQTLRNYIYLLGLYLNFLFVYIYSSCCFIYNKIKYPFATTVTYEDYISVIYQLSPNDNIYSVHIPIEKEILSLLSLNRYDLLYYRIRNYICFPFTFFSNNNTVLNIWFIKNPYSSEITKYELPVNKYNSLYQITKAVGKNNNSSQTSSNITEIICNDAGPNIDFYNHDYKASKYGFDEIEITVGFDCCDDEDEDEDKDMVFKINSENTTLDFTCWFKTKFPASP